ncbi:uncharacterized protein LOC129588984 [Paramacrobiotus metropolitanus]|uniref:uncharacterized protein LOC129588984 n=1 Tax=Paramacrobiotus metropolitanus TaxID=2943436 RepID=UPI002445CF97|nr:uncharacterized protein LOC129588984 [Paramacrobiotus metropolitanus]
MHVMQVWLCVLAAVLPALLAMNQPDQLFDGDPNSANTTAKDDELLCMEEEFPIAVNGDEKTKEAMHCFPSPSHHIAKCTERVQQLEQTIAQLQQPQEHFGIAETPGSSRSTPTTAQSEKIEPGKDADTSIELWPMRMPCWLLHFTFILCVIIAMYWAGFIVFGLLWCCVNPVLAGWMGFLAACIAGISLLKFGCLL